MTQVSVFNFNQNEVRTVVRDDGEIWFVAPDVAMALGYRNAPDMVRNLDNDEVSTTQIVRSSSGGNPNITIINESGLYSATLKSRKPEAKQFKKWVTSEVLPSIRKNGGYIAGQENDDPELIIAKALQVAQHIIDRKSQELEQAKAQVEAAAPKVRHYDLVAERTALLNATQVGQKVKFSAQKLNKYLESFNVYSLAVKRGKAFKQWFVDAGYGIMRQTELGYAQPMFTTKGEAWIIEKLVSEGIVQ